ncbi:peptidoglycan-associated lipoprotein Pal [bacterium]|nr:peptidoglycan-associated lipoprotein Pal [bacterium]
MKDRIIYLIILGAVCVIAGCGGSKAVSTAQQETGAAAADSMTVVPEGRPAADSREIDRRVMDLLTEKEAKAESRELVLQPVYFELDESDLTPEARSILGGLADALAVNPGISIMIEGHCDERGTIEYNLALGERRATAVKEYLVNYGVNAARLYTISYGKERPADPGHSEAAWAKNRRAEFRIVGQ